MMAVVAGDLSGQTVTAQASVVSASGDQPPKPLENPGNWVTVDDYPAEALKNDVAGITGFTLSVDASGIPTACNVTQSSGSALLDSTTCSLMLQRARFLPAMVAGKPMHGSYTSQVKWVTSEDAPVGPSVTIHRAIVEADGSFSQCEQGWAKGKDTKNVVLTPDVCGSPRYDQGYTDSNGKPVRRQITWTTTEEVSDPLN